MKKIMTPAEYVAARGLICPVCGGDNIKASEIEEEKSGEEFRGHSDCNCIGCGSSWGEWFDRSTYTELVDVNGDDIEIPDAEVDLVALSEAAPDLLTALEAMLGAFGHLALTDPPNRWPEIELVQKALAKVKGE